MLHHRIATLFRRTILISLCLISTASTTFADELVFQEEKIETAVGSIAVPNSLSKPVEQVLAPGATATVATGDGTAIIVQAVPSRKPLDEARAREIAEALISGLPPDQRKNTRIESLKMASLPVDGSFRARLLTVFSSGQQRETGISVSALDGKNLVIMAAGFDEQQFESILKTFERTESEETSDSTVNPANTITNAEEMTLKGEILERQLKSWQPYALLLYGAVVLASVLVGRKRGKRLSYGVGLVGFFVVWVASLAKAVGFASSLDPGLVEDDYVLAFIGGFSTRPLLLAAVAQILAWKLFLPKGPAPRARHASS